jgi:hypothetical protein
MLVSVSVRVVAAIVPRVIVIRLVAVSRTIDDGVPLVGEADDDDGRGAGPAGKDALRIDHLAEGALPAGAATHRAVG